MIKDKETYNEARSAFDGLRIEEQAIFLVESTVSMLATGIEQLGAMMARQFDDDGETTAEGTGTADEGTKKRAAKTSAAKKPRRTTTAGTTSRKPRTKKSDTDTTP